MTKQQIQEVRDMLLRFDGARALCEDANFQYDDDSYDILCVSILTKIYNLVFESSK